MNRILVTQRISQDKHGEYIDYLEANYIKFLKKFKIIPVLLPNNITDPVKFLSDLKCERIILTGGDDIYELSNRKNRNDFIYKRDSNEKKLIKYALKNKIPTFCICRGFQLMNISLGGQVTKNLVREIQNQQEVIIVDKNKRRKVILVNSFHHHAVKVNQLSKHLLAKGLSSSGDYVEYFAHEKLPIIGIQWHPERKMKSKKFNDDLFSKFLKM